MTNEYDIFERILEQSSPSEIGELFEDCKIYKSMASAYNPANKFKSIILEDISEGEIK
jgi:hypothetical protein